MYENETTRSNGEGKVQLSVYQQWDELCLLKGKKKKKFCPEIKGLVIPEWEKGLWRRKQESCRRFKERKFYLLWPKLAVLMG